MPDRFSSLLYLVAFYVVTELNINVASQTTATTDSTEASTPTTPPVPRPNQTLELTLRFGVDFNASYLDNSSAPYKEMYNGLDKTFSNTIYQNNVLSVTILSVSPGSVVVAMQLGLKDYVNTTELRQKLDTYIASCTNASNCFDFGPVENVTRFETEDKRCDTFICRNGTVCETRPDGAPPHCVCPVGYNMTNATSSSNDTSGDFQCEAVPMTCHLSMWNTCLRNASDNSTTCDPCHGSPIVCNETLGQVCVGNATCAPVCGCPPDKKMVNDTCLDACAIESPCRNGGNCTANTASYAYTCTCPPEYTGVNCTEDVDECISTQRPPKCPKNDYFCVNTQPGYTCGCIAGFVLNSNTSECVKVNQILKTTITLNYEYRAHFKNRTTDEYKMLLNSFTQALEKIYNNSTILFVDITNVQEGSIVVDLTINFEDYTTDKRARLDEYINTECANGSKCFGLGPFLKKTDREDQDTRCEGIQCLANTKCQPLDDNGLSCVCSGAGFKSTGDIGGAECSRVNYMETCQDIDECTQSNICAENEDCTNTVGSYQCSCRYGIVDGKCTPPCSSNPCGSKGQCEKIDDRSYRCTCDWTHTGRNCESAMPLIFMILMCIFIILFLAAAAMAIFCSKQAQKDKIKVNDYPPYASRTAGRRSPGF